MDTKKLKNEFEAKFYAAKSDKNLSQLKTCFLMPFFKTASDSYKKSCMDNLVTSGYENPEFAKWSLTTTDVEFNGDIHKNADRPLRLAAQFNIEFAKYLLTSPDLKEKANINETNDGSSVLLEAIKCNNLEFVKYLLTSPELAVKSSLNIADNDFDDPLCKACDKNHTEIVKYLLASQDLSENADIHRFDYTALNKVICNDNLELFEFIISNNLIDVNEDLNNWFCKAVIYNSPEIATYLKDFFKTNPDLISMKYKDKSLFLNIVKSVHYSGVKDHYYLYSILDDKKFILSNEEKKELDSFWIKHNDISMPILQLIKKYEDKLTLEKDLNITTKKTTKPKI